MIAQTGATVKAVTLDVVAGFQTLSWLFAEGAQSFNYVWASSWGPSVCSIVSIPVPWDAVFRQKWGAFVQAFGARYANNPTVTGVKISGLNSYDEETSLPYSVNAPISYNGTSCTSYNDVAKWQAISYTRTLLESSWNQIAADFKSTFPNKTLVATLDMGGFAANRQQRRHLHSWSAQQPAQSGLDGAPGSYG